VRAGVGLPSVWDGLVGQIFLGSERFVAKMQRRASRAGDLGEIPRVQRRPVAKPLGHYARKYRDTHEAMARAYLAGDYTLKAIGEYFNVHYATVSRAVREIEQGERR